VGTRAGLRRFQTSYRRVVLVCVVVAVVAIGVSQALGGSPVVSAVAALVAVAASFVTFVAMGPRFEKTIYQDPRSPINQEFRGVQGLWPYGGGAVAIGFRDPADAPVFPEVAEDSSHRSHPPAWLLEDQGQSAVSSGEADADPSP
jgi:hypothetical protein